MIRQFLNITFQIDKSKVDDVLNDINLFYSSLQQYDGAFDDWYFKNVFTAPYWRYLKHYRWLSTKEQNYLHRGVLSFILFMSYQSLKEESDIVEVNLKEILKSLEMFTSSNHKTSKLKGLAQNSIKIVNQKIKGNANNSNKIINSIKWTLTNIIINNKEENVNQR